MTQIKMMRIIIKSWQDRKCARGSESDRISSLALETEGDFQEVVVH